MSSSSAEEEYFEDEEIFEDYDEEITDEEILEENDDRDDDVYEEEIIENSGRISNEDECSDEEGHNHVKKCSDYESNDASHERRDSLDSLEPNSEPASHCSNEESNLTSSVGLGKISNDNQELHNVDSCIRVRCSSKSSNLTCERNNHSLIMNDLLNAVNLEFNPSNVNDVPQIDENEETSISDQSHVSMNLMEIGNQKSPPYCKSRAHSNSTLSCFSPRASAFKSHNKNAQSLNGSNVSFADSVTMFSSADSMKGTDNSISLSSLSPKVVKESVPEETSESENLKKSFVKLGFQAGFMMAIAPLWMLIRRCFCRGEDAADVPLPNSNPGLEHQILQESSRHTIGGVYVQGDPVSKEVLRQAAIQAARSAGTQASQGAAVLATSGAAAAGTAVATKVALAGVLAAILIGGSIITGVTVTSRNERRKGSGDFTLDVGGGGEGGGEGKGGDENCNIFGDANITIEGCGNAVVLCPVGEVIAPSENDSEPECVSAVDICEVWQKAVNGVCVNCDPGHVSVTVGGVPTHKGCEACPRGQVRSSADGMTLGPCISAEGLCEEWEWAFDGMCSTCSTGQVSVLGNDGRLSHEDCQYCPTGQVRSQADGNGEGPCVSASSHCEPWQMAENGICSNCQPGMISSLDPITLRPTYSDCSYCPDGEVRSSSDGSALGVCVRAESFCELWQYATLGKCTDCPPGEQSLSDANGTYDFQSCAFCPDGQVRGNRDGDGQSPCISATGICTEFEAAIEGKCRECSYGQMTSIDAVTLQLDHKECIYCPPGEVRSSRDGFGLGPCVKAEDFCEVWEKAEYGSCTNCPVGQVAAVGANGLMHETCVFCDVGEVRQTSDGRGEGPCVKAYGRCFETQRAIRGVCVNCLPGQFSSRGQFGLYDHMACIRP